MLLKRIVCELLPELEAGFGKPARQDDDQCADKPARQPSRVLADLRAEGGDEDAGGQGGDESQAPTSGRTDQEARREAPAPKDRILPHLAASSRKSATSSSPLAR